jgi:putative oxidoreductase
MHPGHDRCAGNKSKLALFDGKRAEKVTANRRMAAMRRECMSDKIDERRLIIPALGKIYQAGAPYSYAFIRFATGAILFPHGFQKVFHSSPDRLAVGIANKGLPLALTLAYLTFFSEFVASAFLAIGLLTRIAAAMIFIQMLVIVILFQGPFGYFWTDRGYEFALLWAAVCLAIFFRGGGRWSVDHYIGKEF